jgi:general secretion pathway protein N
LLDRLSNGRVQVRDASGTLWNGQARLSLSAGPDSGVQMAVPGFLSWNLRPVWNSASGPGLQIQAQHPVLKGQTALLAAQLGVRRSGLRWSFQLQGAQGNGLLTAQLPAAWLAGLGAPWNTLQPSGRLQFRLERLSGAVQGAEPVTLDLALRIELLDIASRISTLPVLGDYELLLEGGPVVDARLSSRPGSALQLEGLGRWTLGGPVAFHGQAWALAGREEALSNLLNIIGRRDGPRSLMAYGSPGPDSPPAPTQ